MKAVWNLSLLMTRIVKSLKMAFCRATRSIPRKAPVHVCIHQRATISPNQQAAMPVLRWEATLVDLTMCLRCTKNLLLN